MISIYKITNPSGNIYIGQTKNLKKRFQYYQSRSCECQVKLCNSIKKHGWDNHKVEILEETTQEKASLREIYWIELFKTNYKRYPESNGLNLTDGGENNKGNNIRRVFEYTLAGEFVKEWASQADAVAAYNFGQNHIHQACSGKLHTVGGKRWTYEKVDKLEPIKKRRSDVKYTDIYQFTKDGSFIKVWNNVGEIVAAFQGSYAGVSACLKGLRPTYKGYKWSLKKEMYDKVV
jgi:group I intron endonuclease